MASLETCIVTNTMKNTESDFEAQVVKKRRKKKKQKEDRDIVIIYKFVDISSCDLPALCNFLMRATM